MTSQIAYPVSIKGVVVREDKVLLLRNEREEWGLPGGWIELGKSPEQCVVREIAEETRWRVIAAAILDSWMYYIDAADKNVFIVTYGCYPVRAAEPVLSHEHKDIGLFGESDVDGLAMLAGYKRLIKAWFAQFLPTPWNERGSPAEQRVRPLPARR